MKDEAQREYLGDGIYVEFDGDEYALSVNDHRDPPVVCMSLESIAALNRFVARMTDTPSSSENPNSSGEKVDRSNQCTISGADPDEVQAKKRGKRSE